MSTGKKKWIGAAAAVALVVVGVVVFTSRDSGGASDKDLIITAAVKRQTLQDKVTLSGTLGRVWAPALYTFLAMNWGAAGWLVIAPGQDE